MGIELYVVVWLFFGILTAIVAANYKNRNGFGWFIIGFLFGPFGLILAVVMPKKSLESSSSIAKKPGGNYRRDVQPSRVKPSAFEITTSYDEFDETGWIISEGNLLDHDGNFHLASKEQTVRHRP